MSKLKRKRIISDLKNNVYDDIMYSFDDLQYEIIKELETSYDQKLNSIRFPRGSFMTPSEYLSDFIEAMYDTDWIVYDKDSIKFSYPNEENFIWPSNLEPIKVMVEGVARSRYPYVELSRDHARKIGVAKKDFKGFDFRVKGRTFYLILRTSIIKTRMEENKIQEKIYPLSKSGPINIFEDIDDFVSDRMSNIISGVSKQSVDKTCKKFGA